MTTLKRDWLAGGWVPEGGLGTFLPTIMTPRRPAAKQSTSARTPRAPKEPRSPLASPRTHRAPLSDRSLDRRHPLQDEPHSWKGTARRKRERMRTALLAEMEAGYNPGLAAQNPMYVGADARASHPIPRKSLRNRHSAATTMRTAQGLGLRGEVEQCAAIILQACARARIDRTHYIMVSAAVLLQRAIRARIKVKQRAAKGKELNMGHHEAHREKAKHLQDAAHRQEFLNRFGEWWDERERQKAVEVMDRRWRGGDDIAMDMGALELARETEEEAAIEASLEKDRQRSQRSYESRMRLRKIHLCKQVITDGYESINNIRDKTGEGELEQARKQDERAHKQIHMQVAGICFAAWQEYVRAIATASASYVPAWTGRTELETRTAAEGKRAADTAVVQNIKALLGGPVDNDGSTTAAFFAWKKWSELLRTDLHWEKERIRLQARSGLVPISYFGEIVSAR